MKTILHPVCPWLAAATIMAAFAALSSYMDDKRNAFTDAIAAEEECAAAASRQWAARQACGPNSTPIWVSDKDIQCLTTGGHKASMQVVAEVSQ